MASKINSELLKRLREIEASSKGGGVAASNAPREVPVIVTVDSVDDVKALEKKGFKLERKFESISAVSGTLPADMDSVKSFAEELDQVKAVEYDGEMHALEDEDV